MFQQVLARVRCAIRGRMTKTLSALAPLAAFALALAALIGSLIAQQMGYEPCVLCWWQRVFVYPLVLLIPVGILRKDAKLSSYVLPLSIAGALVALYQTLLYYHVISESLAPCTVGVPCTQLLPSFLGFNLITASLATFVLISILMLIHRKGSTTSANT